MSKVLVIAEHEKAEVTPATAACVTAAQSLGDAVDLLVAGSDISAIVQQAQRLNAVTQVIAADHLAYQHSLAENLAALVESLAADYQFILAPANTFGKNVLPRVAGLLDSDMVSDITQIIDGKTFVRPIYAGNAQETLQLEQACTCITVRPTAFAPAQQGEHTAPVVDCERVCDLGLTQFISLKQEKSARPELSSAKRVVSGGRGLRSKENFKLIEDLADTVDAAIGATRAAVDAGYIANEYQVGQTGKVVAPDLYIAVGISGAIQHLAGMKDSKVIVAINKDAEAPIFKVADYGLVGDLFEIVPELISQLK